ncbi:Alanine racemase Alr [Helicobacter sp. NHP19-003]|uniref:Alanine racemase n=1 Tax=Helicobacter gastrocanis TaxID=2849641 RepID=A0ABM7S7V4_9HELI|nr:alanine racemase [Helicobacter sp. NHP19-003]BCZ16734.1 Alanine racemase Alr [Helicobacter sp. NHP19-003]
MQESLPPRASFVEVNAAALAHNFSVIRKVCQMPLMAVVKANAYGAGVLGASRVFVKQGAIYLGVATLDEALELRTEFKDIPILILGYTPDHMAKTLVEQKITQTIFSLKQAEHFSQVALSLKQKLKVHVKVDTGMSRLGFLPTKENAYEVVKIAKLKGLEVEGIFTHHSNADAMFKNYALEQAIRFLDFLAKLKNLGLEFKYRHMANSAAALSMDNYGLDLARAGLALYGLHPSIYTQDALNKKGFELQHAITLKAQIVSLKTIEAGQLVGYGEGYYCLEPTRVGVLPLGYGDGISKVLGNKAWGLLHGQKVPIIGGVCMDQCFIDVGKIEAQEGDEVILLGDPQSGAMGAGDVSKILGIINYEAITMLTRRLPRIYTHTS